MHRTTGDRTQRAGNIGWEYFFVAVDDHSRIAFTSGYPDENQVSAVDYVHQAARHFASLIIPIQRVLVWHPTQPRSMPHAWRCT